MEPGGSVFLKDICSVALWKVPRVRTVADWVVETVTSNAGLLGGLSVFDGLQQMNHLEPVPDAGPATGQNFTAGATEHWDDYRLIGKFKARASQQLLLGVVPLPTNFAALLISVSEEREMTTCQHVSISPATCSD
jgi:hypothetical protein